MLRSISLANWLTPSKGADVNRGLAGVSIYVAGYCCCVTTERVCACFKAVFSK